MAEISSNKKLVSAASDLKAGEIKQFLSTVTLAAPVEVEVSGGVVTMTVKDVD